MVQDRERLHAGPLQPLQDFKPVQSSLSKVTQTAPGSAMQEQGGGQRKSAGLIHDGARDVHAAAGQRAARDQPLHLDDDHAARVVRRHGLRSSSRASTLNLEP